MSNDLVVRRNMDLSFDEMTRAAKAMALSGYFNDAKETSQAMVKVLAGAEIGLGPFASMTGIHIVKGKPTLGANLIATLIKNDPRYNYRVERLDDDACEIAFFEEGERVGESSFSLDDAKQAGLLNNNTWKSYPRNMLFARAISNGARWYTPGIFGGATIYTPDEMGVDEDEAGNIIDVTPPRVDVETGEILDDEPASAEWEDLQSASETPANGNGTQPDPLQAARDSLTGKTSTLADIATAAVMTGLYDNQPHAWNTVKMYDWPESDKFELKAEQKVKTETAHEVLDWMIVRKLDEQDAKETEAA